MWKVVHFDQETAKFTDGGRYSSLEECKGKAMATGSSFYFWASDYPQDKEALHAIIAQIFQANGSRILAVFPGTRISVSGLPERAFCGCSGECFCVYQGGGCTCGASYCDANGCIWVQCAGGC